MMRRALDWPAERPSNDEYVDDIYDSELWAYFKADPVVNSNSNPKEPDLPVFPLALAFCGDGVEANRGHHKKAHSVFCLAACILNLPPWVRSKLSSSHLPMCIPGPGKPKDAQVYFDIPSDELVYLYEVGVRAYHAGRCKQICMQKQFQAC